jgi:hypothetical protein
MTVNFCLEPVVLQKAKVLGLAEETNDGVTAAINDVDTGNGRQIHQQAKGGMRDTMLSQFMKDKLGHLSERERAVMESVLRRYRHVFHVEGFSDFQATAFMEHRIINGDANPIRKRPYRVPFALRGEMESQVRDMLAKGFIEESSSPWNSPAILVPKTSPDGKPKYRFCVDFRALNALTR